MLKTIITVCLFVISFNAYSVRCFITGVKANCWEAYNVTVDVIDTASGNKVTSIIIPAQSLWARQEFDCSPAQNFKFEATFNPIIWEKDKGKVYSGINFWKLPQVAPKKGEVWHLNVCFPSNLAQVPLPPEAGQKCVCDMKNIDPIEL